MNLLKYPKKVLFVIFHPIRAFMKLFTAPTVRETIQAEITQQLNIVKQAENAIFSNRYVQHGAIRRIEALQEWKMKNGFPTDDIVLPGNLEVDEGDKLGLAKFKTFKPSLVNELMS